MQAIQTICKARWSCWLLRCANFALAIYSFSGGRSRSRLNTIMCASTAMQLGCLDLLQPIRVIRKAHWSCWLLRHAIIVPAFYVILVLLVRDSAFNQSIMCASTTIQLGCLDVLQAVRVIRKAQWSCWLPRYVIVALAIYNFGVARSRSRLQSTMCASTAMVAAGLNVLQATRVVRKAQWSCWLLRNAIFVPAFYSFGAARSRPRLQAIKCALTAMQRAVSLQEITRKANLSSERRSQDVGAGCVDGRSCASTKFDIFHWNDPVPLRNIAGKTLRCTQRLACS